MPLEGCLSLRQIIRGEAKPDHVTKMIRRELHQIAIRAVDLSRDFFEVAMQPVSLDETVGVLPRIPQRGDECLLVGVRRMLPKRRGGPCRWYADLSVSFKRTVPSGGPCPTFLAAVLEARELCKS
jgi:hypothetical protein